MRTTCPLFGCDNSNFASDLFNAVQSHLSDIITGHRRSVIVYQWILQHHGPSLSLKGLLAVLLMLRNKIYHTLATQFSKFIKELQGSISAYFF
jgi:hypothetical protein